MITIAKLSGRTGAELPGVKLDRSLDPASAKAIVNAFDQHAVLLFRGQSLDAQAQIELTRLFGEVRPHPLASHRGPEPFPEVSMVEHRPGLRVRRNDIWHSDVSFAEEPPTATVLHAIEVPAGRGDTLICNLAAAYESLSDGLKALLGGLRSIHSADRELDQVRRQRGNLDEIETPHPVSHPVVRAHQPSGEKALFVNPHLTSHIEGMTPAESQPMLDYLYALSVRPENVYRHRWEAGDVLMWDNTRTMHYAIRDYDDDSVRVMQRTTAAGAKPQ